MLESEEIALFDQSPTEQANLNEPPPFIKDLKRWIYTSALDPVRAKALELALAGRDGWADEKVIERAIAFETYLRNGHG